MGLPARDAELVQIMDSALADAARRAGPWLVCRPGCTQCCYGVFSISPLDSLRLRAGMDELRGANPSLAAVIERRAAAWLDQHRPAFPGNTTTGLLGVSDAERERFEDFASEAACPALDPDTGRCDVYTWRPMTCRVFGPPVRMANEEDESPALGHCELCFTGATLAEVAACEMPLPHALEASILDELHRQGLDGETVVAFALLPDEPA